MSKRPTVRAARQATLMARPRGEEDSANLSVGITLIISVLAALGLVLIYSSTSTGIAHADHTRFLRGQLLWIVLGTGTFVLARTTALDELQRYARPLLILVAVALLACLIPGIGTRVNGSARWLRFGPMQGQPSELAKLAVILYLAAWSAPRQAQLGTVQGALPAFGVLGAICGLVALEPDIGTTLLIGSVGTTILLAAGVKIRHLLLAGGPAALVLGLFVATKLTYIHNRIAAFLDPESDPAGAGYQTTQTLIALGSGGTLGKGLGSSQQKLFFLPEVHTDYIFALVGEELGLVGTLTVLSLFAALVWFGLRTVERARDRFSFLVALGLVLTLGVQALLNMAVATGSVPPKGIALPFVSFGGSSLLAASAAAGILARIAAEGRPTEPLPLLNAAQRAHLRERWHAFRHRHDPPNLEDSLEL